MKAKATTQRESLNAQIEQVRQRLEEIPSVLFETQERYSAALDEMNRSEAQRLKAEMRRLEDETEICEEQIKRLEARWPEIEKAEAAEQLPGLIRSFGTDVQRLAETTHAAEVQFFAGIEALETVRTERHRILSNAAAIKVLAQTAGSTAPELPEVPRPEAQRIVCTVGRIRSACQ